MEQPRDLLSRVAGFLEQREIAGYVVGGAVRDRLLSEIGSTDRDPYDIDLAVDANIVPLADELADETSGTVIVIDEVRGYLRVVDSDDELRWIDLTAIEGGLAEDLARRDLTINAIAVPFRNWIDCKPTDSILPFVIDQNGGVADLSGGVLRETAPGNLVDDPVRMLRAVRFVSHLGFELEPATAKVISENVGRLSESAPERIREEFFALLAGRRPDHGIREMDRFGMLQLLLPEFTVGRGFEQPGMHYYDVMEHQLHALDVAACVTDTELRLADPILRHTAWRPEFDEYLAEVVGDGLTRSTVLRFVAMLHDVGKPATMTRETPDENHPNGRIRFLGHGEVGARMATDFLTRLRCSRRTISHVSLMIEEHLRPFQMSDGTAPPSGRAILRFFRDVSPVAVDTILLSVCDYASTAGPLLKRSSFQRYSAMLSDILARGLEPEPERPSKDLLLDGHEVQERFGLQPGPEIGRLLGALRDGESSGVVRTKAEAYELLARLLGRAASRRGRP